MQPYRCLHGIYFLLFFSMETTSTTSAQVPRAAFAAELDELRAYCQDLCDCPDLVDGACVAVFDHYATDCPGYAGKILLVVWGGMPSQVDSFVWLDGKMKKSQED